MRYSPNSRISLRFREGNEALGSGASRTHSRSTRSSWYMRAKVVSSSHLRLMAPLLGPGEGWPVVSQVLGESL